MAYQNDASPSVPAEPQDCREFRLSDAMILLAGLAISLSMGSYLLVLFVEAFSRLCSEAWGNATYLFTDSFVLWKTIENHMRNTLWYGLQVLEILLGGMIPAFLVMRLRRPRLPLRSLIRQPGTVAALAAVFGLFWGTGWLHIIFADGIRSEIACRHRGRRDCGCRLDRPFFQRLGPSRGRMDRPPGAAARSGHAHSLVPRLHRLSDLKPREGAGHVPIHKVGKGNAGAGNGVTPS